MWKTKPKLIDRRSDSGDIDTTIQGELENDSRGEGPLVLTKSIAVEGVLPSVSL